MRVYLLTIASLIDLSHGASISCGAPLRTGPIYYGNSASGFYEGQVGILEAYGNPELLATYPNSNVVQHNITVIPCNSTALNATIPPHGAWGKDTPVILQLADDTSNCLSLESDGAADVFVTKQACQYEDTVNSQQAQFWTRDFTHHNMTPTWESQHKGRWYLVRNEYDTEEILAEPAKCFEGQSCQNSTHYNLSVK
jgi:hypothetical protein